MHLPKALSPPVPCRRVCAFTRFPSSCCKQLDRALGCWRSARAFCCECTGASIPLCKSSVDRGSLLHTLRDCSSCTCQPPGLLARAAVEQPCCKSVDAEEQPDGGCPEGGACVQERINSCTLVLPSKWKAREWVGLGIPRMQAAFVSSRIIGCLQADT